MMCLGKVTITNNHITISHIPATKYNESYSNKAIYIYQVKYTIWVIFKYKVHRLIVNLHFNEHKKVLCLLNQEK